jgi:endo-1,4-beta-xylanase
LKDNNNKALQITENKKTTMRKTHTRNGIRNGIQYLCALLCLTATISYGGNEERPSFYDPAEDPIPYAPHLNEFGSDYDIPKASWKIKADQRINTFRKADLKIRVVDKNGKPLKDMPVHVQLKRHDFFWGAVISRDSLSSPNRERLQTYFLKYFNSAGFGMGLKPKQCTIEPCQKSWNSRYTHMAEKDMEWFKKHDIPVRGHALIWEGESFLAHELQKIFKDPNLSDAQKGKKIFDHKAQHLLHAAKKWDVFCWDVINEPRKNHDINDLLPKTDTFVEYFRLADAARKEHHLDYLMYYNENQIASFANKGSTFKKHRDIYKARIQEVLDAKIPLDGIGFQYRFKKYVSPETVYKRLCAFDEFELSYQATEFEIKPMKSEKPYSASVKKKMTAELLTLFFSHPNSTGLWHWSLMDNKKSESPHALFSYDGQPRAEAEQWIKMMEEDFNTDKTVSTAQNGIAEVRGFKGIYKVTIGQGTKAKTSIVELQEDTSLKLVY